MRKLSHRGAYRICSKPHRASQRQSWGSGCPPETKFGHVPSDSSLFLTVRAGMWTCRPLWKTYPERSWPSLRVRSRPWGSSGRALPLALTRRNSWCGNSSRGVDGGRSSELQDAGERASREGWGRGGKRYALCWVCDVFGTCASHSFVSLNHRCVKPPFTWYELNEWMLSGWMNKHPWGWESCRELSALPCRDGGAVWLCQVSADRSRWLAQVAREGRF